MSYSQPSSHLTQHCCKLVWDDTVGLHHCLDNRIGQDILECWFGLTTIHNHSFLGARNDDGLFGCKLQPTYIII